MWDYVFYSCSGFYLIGAIFFLIFGTSEEQDFSSNGCNIFTKSELVEKNYKQSKNVEDGPPMR